MSEPTRPPVVIDTGVFGARLTQPGQQLAFTYRALLADRRGFLSFVTVAELRFGAEVAGWGRRRLRRLETEIARADTVWPQEGLLDKYVQLRAWCVRAGHGLGQKDHEADRWVATTAMWLEIPLVAHDRIFLYVDGLSVLTMLER